MRVVHISECFPSTHKPQTCEFILRHTEAMSELCKVKVIVPLRLIPPRESLKAGTAGLASWFKSVRNSNGYTKGNLEVSYLNYISLPRPAFEAIDTKLINAVFSNKLESEIVSFKPDAIICHWLRPWAEVASGIAKRTGIPLMVDHHEDMPTLISLHPGSYKKFLEPLSEADTVIIHSTRNLEELKNELPGLTKAKLIYLGQGLDIRHKPKSNFSDRLHLIAVSHLHEPRKNIDVLIRAIALLREKIDAVLTVAGDGPLKNGLAELAESLGIAEHVKFPGSCSQEQVCDLLDNSDIFVLPSFPEAFGIAITEALARGIPAITCEGSGGGDELKMLGYQAPQAKPGSAEELADCILELYGDQQKMSELSAKGIEIVKEHFTWKANAVNTLEVVKELVVSRKKVS